MPGIFVRRIVDVSGGASCAKPCVPPIRPPALAERPVSTRLRLGAQSMMPPRRSLPAKLSVAATGAHGLPGPLRLKYSTFCSLCVNHDTYLNARAETQDPGKATLFGRFTRNRDLARFRPEAPPLRRSSARR